MGTGSDATIEARPTIRARVEAMRARHRAEGGDAALPAPPEPAPTLPPPPAPPAPPEPAPRPAARVLAFVRSPQ